MAFDTAVYVIITSPTTAVYYGDTAVQHTSITLTQCKFAKSAEGGGFHSAFSVAIGV